jgi:N-acetylneuraminic acid mutarotase
MLKSSLLALTLAASSLMATDLGESKLISHMPRGFFCHQSLVVNDKLYVLGGHGSGKRLPTVCFSVVSADGTLSAWKNTSPLPEGDTGTLGHATAAYNNVIYNLGGTFKDTDKKWKTTSAVVYGKVGPDGKIAEWMRTSSLPAPQRYGMAVAAKGFLYFLGGEKNRLVYVAKIQEDGALGPWQTTSNLISPRCKANVFHYNGFLYLVGGEVIYRKYSEMVFRAKINEDGTLGGWRRTEPMPEKLAAFGAAMVGNNVFTFGGTPQTPAVYTTSIDSEGHFTTWRKLAPLPIEDGVTSLQAAASGKHIYVSGGLVIRPKPKGNTVCRQVYKYDMVESTK